MLEYLTLWKCDTLWFCKVNDWGKWLFFVNINLFLVSLCRPNKDLIANFPDEIDWIYLILHRAGWQTFYERQIFIFSSGTTFLTASVLWADVRIICWMNTGYPNCILYRGLQNWFIPFGNLILSPYNLEFNSTKYFRIIKFNGWKTYLELF